MVEKIPFQGVNRKTDRNIIAFMDNSRFKVEKLSGDTFTAYHTSPFIFTVCKTLEKLEKQEKHEGKYLSHIKKYPGKNDNDIPNLDIFVMYTRNSRILFNNGTEMSCEKDGWEVRFNETSDTHTENTLSEESRNRLIDNFLQPKNSETYLLKTTDENGVDTEDRIDKAIEFIKAMCEISQPPGRLTRSEQKGENISLKSRKNLPFVR